MANLFLLLYYTINSALLGILFFLPTQIYIFNIHSKIFPATDLIIIFYLISCHRINYGLLLILGIIQDSIYSYPLGSSSLALISAAIILNLCSKSMDIKNYLINHLLFAAYCLLVIIIRAVFIALISKNHFVGDISIYFYFVVTLFSYPICRYCFVKYLKCTNQYFLTS